jgi:hypothetical protein
MRFAGACARALLMLSLISLFAPCQAERPAAFPVTITATDADYHNAIVVIPLGRAYQGFKAHTVELVDHKAKRGKSGDRLAADIVLRGDRMELVTIIPELAKGSSRTFYVVTPVGGISRPLGVTVERAGKDVEIKVMPVGAAQSALFTRYLTASAPNKPCFYPMLTADGTNITRRWPMEKDVSSDSHDHPHHRGMWFTHGSVNGVDFWSETRNTGKTINTGIEDVQSGAVCGTFRAHTDWQVPDGRVIARDVRDVTVYPVPGGTLLDFDITITAVGGPLVFGDTKEGMFGLRLADSLSPHPTFPLRPKGAHCVNSEGLKDTALWGKPANWVDYYGPLGSGNFGVAMFDAPDNIRHPETWHARDYGLFAVNPFGLHDFGAGPAGAGDFTVPEGKTVRFRYRLYFHADEADKAGVAQQYAAFADPPHAQVAGGAAGAKRKR